MIELLSNNSLRSKCFHGVKKQRKTKEWNFYTGKILKILFLLGLSLLPSCMETLATQANQIITKHTFVLLFFVATLLKLEEISLAKIPPLMSPIISLLYLLYSTQSAK